jgi:hypothetical protein
MTLVDNELQVFYPKYGFVLYTIRLDGKTYALTSPNAAPGTSSMAEGLGARTLRRVIYQDEKPTLEATMGVSADGETMTVTVRIPRRAASNEPSIAIYERQH